MTKAAILRDYRFIKTTNLQKLRFDLLGFLVEFTLSKNNITYVFVAEKDLNQDDLDNSNGGSIDSPQYYSKSQFLKYLDKQIFLKELRDNDGLKNDDIQNANDDDIVTVQKLRMVPPDYTQFGSVETYFVAKKNVRVEENAKITFTTSPAPTVKLINNLHPSSLLFYEARSYILLNYTDPTEKQEVAYLLASIALIINMINRDIFSIIFENASSAVTEFINGQNNEWATGDILNAPTAKDLQLYFQSLSSFYRDTFSNQLKIIRAESSEKLYWLASVLSINGLSTLSVNGKTNLLEFLTKRLTTWTENSKDEELVIKIVLSFNQNNINEIDAFLTALLTIKPDYSSQMTLYEALYKRMSTSTNFTEGVFSLNNWVFKTNYKPNQTKGQYVQAVYALWQFSKYNPYNDDGSIKSKTLGFKMLNPNIASFTNEDSDENKNMLFYYSHIVGYEREPWDVSSQYTGPQLYAYKTVYDDAVAMVMPFESEKFLGVYFDNFSFEFSNDKILAYQKLPTAYEYASDGTTVNLSQPIAINSNVLFSRYDIFQPVTILNTNQETKAPILTTDGNSINIDGLNINSFIPVFALEYISNASDRSNAETMLGYLIDGVLTFSGVGNLTKLRHLRWAAIGAEEIGLWTIEGLRVVVGGVDFTSGVLSYLLNFINCDENNDFCKGLKSFLNALQIASLSINTIDSLATLTARLKARRLLDIVSDSTDDAIIQADLAEALGGGAEAINAAHTILQFADRASQLEGYLNHAIQIQKLVVKKIEQSFDLIKMNQFRKFSFTTDAIEDIVTHISTKVNFAGQLLDKVCADFVFIASKEGKLITKEELIKQITFFYDEVLKRGYPSGFLGLDKFKIFCNKTKNFLSGRFQFWEENILDSIDWERLGFSEEYIDEYWRDFNFSERVELIVQGSANRKYLAGDNLEYTLVENAPIGNPKDFEFAARMNDTDFKILIQIGLATFGKDTQLGAKFLNSLKKGFIDKNMLYLINKDLFDDFRDLIKDDTRFPKLEVDFAIVKAGGPYDLEPHLNFQF